MSTKTPTPDEANAALETILKKASTDKKFRQLALTNPREAIKQTAGFDAPKNYNVSFIEKDKNLDALIVLPDMVTKGELSDAELEGVAGGYMDGWCVLSVTVPVSK